MSSPTLLSPPQKTKMASISWLYLCGKCHIGKKKKKKKERGKEIIILFLAKNKCLLASALNWYTVLSLALQF
jgi:hypothetical protein